MKDFLSTSRLPLGASYYPEHRSENCRLERVIRELASAGKVATLVAAPGMEVCTRVRSDRDEIFRIVINHATTERTVTMPWPSFDHLKGVPLAAEFKLSAYAVAIHSPSKKQEVS